MTPAPKWKQKTKQNETKQKSPSHCAPTSQPQEKTLKVVSLAWEWLTLHETAKEN